jgi:hypothetical protein
LHQGVQVASWEPGTEPKKIERSATWADWRRARKEQRSGAGPQSRISSSRPERQSNDKNEQGKTQQSTTSTTCGSKLSLLDNFLSGRAGAMGNPAGRAEAEGDVDWSSSSPLRRCGIEPCELERELNCGEESPRCCTESCGLDCCAGGGVRGATVGDWLPGVLEGLELRSGWPESELRLVALLAGRRCKSGDADPLSAESGDGEDTWG